MMELSKKGDFRFVGLEGGTAGNAIAPVSSAVCWMEDADQAVFEQMISRPETVLQNEYAVTDPGIRIEAETAVLGEWDVFDAASNRNVTALLFLMPNGV